MVRVSFMGEYKQGGTSKQEDLVFEAAEEGALPEVIEKWARENGVDLSTLAMPNVYTTVKRAGVVVSRGHFEPMSLYRARFKWRYPAPQAAASRTELVPTFV